MLTSTSEMKPSRRVCPIEMRRKAVAMHKAGSGAKHIAHVLKVDRNTVRGWLRRYEEYGAQSLRPWWRATRKKDD